MSHVPGDEDARDAGLQEVRITIEFPASGAPSVPGEIRAREYEAPLVALDDAVKPVGVRGSPDKDKERLRGSDLRLPRSGVFYGDPLQVRSEERRVGKECRSRWSPYH